MAYCLLGLFVVNVPLPYGGERKEFMRLQLEIIKPNKDESIFARSSRNLYWRGLLTPQVCAFEISHNVQSIPKLPGDRLPYATTNKELQFRLIMSRQ